MNKFVENDHEKVRHSHVNPRKKEILYSIKGGLLVVDLINSNQWLHAEKDRNPKSRGEFRYRSLWINVFSDWGWFVVFQVDRLMELHFKYLERVRLCDQQIERDKAVNICPMKHWPIIEMMKIQWRSVLTLSYLYQLQVFIFEFGKKSKSEEKLLWYFILLSCSGPSALQREWWSGGWRRRW